MIKSFRHKGLAKLYESGKKAGVQTAHAKKLRLILGVLEAAKAPKDVGLPGLELHPLKVVLEGFWAITVSGNWRIIFQLDGEDAVNVDYVDYH
jgi:proteic killer suppression protein